MPNMKKRNSNCMKIKASVTLKCYYILLFPISILDLYFSLFDLMTFFTSCFFAPLKGLLSYEICLVIYIAQ